MKLGISPDIHGISDINIPNETHPLQIVPFYFQAHLPGLGTQSSFRSLFEWLTWKRNWCIMGITGRWRWQRTLKGAEMYRPWLLTKSDPEGLFVKLSQALRALFSKGDAKEIRWKGVLVKEWSIVVCFFFFFNTGHHVLKIYVLCADSFKEHIYCENWDPIMTDLEMYEYYLKDWTLRSYLLLAYSLHGQRIHRTGRTRFLIAFYLQSSVFSGCCKLSSLSMLHVNISQFSLDFPSQSVVKRVPELCLFGRWPFMDLGREQRWLSFLASRLLAFEKGNSITCFHCTISLPVLTLFLRSCQLA